VSDQYGVHNLGLYVIFLAKLIQVTADIMNPVAHWAWGYLKRIGNKEMAAIIEWERG
jgi:hypothetical protein